MKALLIGFLLCMSFLGYGQMTEPPAKQVAVARETWIVASGQKSFRVITSDTAMAHALMSRFENNGMDKFVYTKKVDKRKAEDYWERQYYFKNEMWNNVVDVIKAVKARK